MATNGILTLEVIEAKLTRDVETFSKMDPYVVIVNRMQQVRTTEKSGAGKTPVWNESFDLDVKYIGDDILIKVMDANVSKDTQIGEASVKLSSMCVNGGIDEWWTIAHKGKKAGQLHLKGTWKPAGGAPGLGQVAGAQATQAAAAQQPYAQPVYTQ